MQQKPSRAPHITTVVWIILALIAALLLTGCSGGEKAVSGGAEVRNVSAGLSLGSGAPAGGVRSNPGGGLPGGGAMPDLGGTLPGGGSGRAPLGGSSFGQGGVQNPGGGLGGPGGAGSFGPGFGGFEPGGNLAGSLPGGGAGDEALGGDRGSGLAGGIRGSATPGAGLGGGLTGGVRDAVAGADRPGGLGLFSGEPLNLGGFGGFGVVTGGPAPIPDGDTPPGDDHAWLPDGPEPGDSGVEWPEPPTLYDGIDEAIDLQQQAQEAAEQAAGNVQEAAEAAQGAYEQVWEDYYDAVDYAAEAYYDAVIGAAESTYDVYSQAVADAYQAASYVYDNYASYAVYCYAYPWDCYDYVYDESAGIYTTTQIINNYYTTYVAGEGETGAQPTAEPAPAVQVPADQVPQPSADAYEALVIFANDQLGLAVTPLYAGEVTADVLALLSALPAEVQQAVVAAPDVSAESYWGLLVGGAAMVSVGDCSTDAPCTLSGEVEVDLSSAAMGAYALRVPEAMPGGADDALSLTQLVFPKLEGIAFTPVEEADAPGYTFYATTTGLGLDATGKPIAVSKGILAGVVPGGDTAVVYALVGVGSYSASLISFN